MIGKFTEWVDTSDILDEANMEGIGTFGAGSHNGGFGYYKQVIEALLNDESVYLVALTKANIPTNVVSENFITKKDFKNINTLKSFLNFAPDAAKENYGLFNDCWSGTINGGEEQSLYNNPIWRYIFKGQFTGGRGANKGNAFESEFAEQFQTFITGGKVDKIYQDTFNKILKYTEHNKKQFKNVVLEGKKNKKRPIEIDGSDVRFTKRNELKLKDKSEEKLNIGETVTDVTINWTKGDPTYLSLKHGDTIEQVNLGISWARDDIDNLFKKVKTGTISQETFQSNKFKWSNYLKNSKTLNFCNFLGIDANKLIWSIWYKDILENPEKNILSWKMHNVSADTKQNAPKEQSYVIEKGSPLYKFILDCIGYGYIYIHFEKNRINCIDLTKPESIDKIFNDNIKAQVLYSNGASKTYVKINIEDTNNFFNGIFEIRPNNGQLAFNVCNLKFNYNHDKLKDVVE